MYAFDVTFFLSFILITALLLSLFKDDDDDDDDDDDARKEKQQRCSCAAATVNDDAIFVGRSVGRERARVFPLTQQTTVLCGGVVVSAFRRREERIQTRIFIYLGFL